MKAWHGWWAHCPFLRPGLLAVLAAGCASQSPRAPYALPPAVTVAEPVSTAPFRVLASWSWSEALVPQVGDGTLTATQAGLHFGLFDASRFRPVTGDCTDCELPDAVLWHFPDELIAVPRAGLPRIRFDTQVGSQATPDSSADPETPTALPSIIWLGASERLTDARLTDDAGALQVDGEQIRLHLVPRLPANRSFVDANTARYFAGRPLTVRGAWRMPEPESGRSDPEFVARTFWPADWRLDAAALSLAPLRASETLGTLIEAPDMVDAGPLPIRLLWEREPQDTLRDWAGRPVLAFILSGAQGDDDGSRGGHLGIATGRIGPDGEWDQWLVENFYPVDDPNAKGIIPASLPVDQYLADVNSGQLYYRPGYMLVAVLRDARVPHQVQQALHGTLLQLYCREVTYYRGRNNSTAMSMDPLREMGWRIPTVGASSRILGWMMAPVVAIAARSFSMGRELAGAMSTERSRMLPRVAFEVAGHDLLALIATATADAADEAPLTSFEQTLADDIEALAFVRLPQIPSSRRFGSYPEQSMLTFGANVFARPGPFQFAPEAPARPFPAELRSSCPSD